MPLVISRICWALSNRAPFLWQRRRIYLCKRNRRLDSQTKINCTRRSHQPMIDCTPPTCAIVSCQCADLRTLIGLQWPSHHYYGALKCLVRAIWDTQFSVSCSSLIDVTERWIVCVEMYKPTSCLECVSGAVCMFVGWWFLLWEKNTAGWLMLSDWC
jgi:hypothetical protein